MRVRGGLSQLGAWSFAAVATRALAACSDPTFQCATQEDCSGGVCQPTGYCSFADDDCASHQRYGEHAAPDYAGTCVGGETTSSGTTMVASTESASTSSSSSTTTLPESSSSSDDGPPPDLPPSDECADLEFDVVPLPGWNAFSENSTASITDGRLVLDLPPVGAGSAGVERTSMTVAGRSFEVEVLTVPDPGTEARLGLTLQGVVSTYSIHYQRGSLFATVDAGDGETELATQPLEDPVGLRMRIVVDDGISFAASALSLGDFELAHEMVILESATVRAVASTPAENDGDPGMIAVERVRDCPADAAQRGP